MNEVEYKINEEESKVIKYEIGEGQENKKCGIRI
jgi:hypothetical protein